MECSKEYIKTEKYNLYKRKKMEPLLEELYKLELDKKHTPCHSKDDSGIQAGRACEQQIRVLLSNGYRFEELPNLLKDSNSKEEICELDGIFHLPYSQYGKFDLDNLMGNTDKIIKILEDPAYVSENYYITIGFEAKSNPKDKDFMDFLNIKLPKYSTYFKKLHSTKKEYTNYFSIFYFVYNGNSSNNFKSFIESIEDKIREVLESLQTPKFGLSLKIVHLLQDQAIKASNTLRDQIEKTLKAENEKTLTEKEKIEKTLTEKEKIEKTLIAEMKKIQMEKEKIQMEKEKIQMDFIKYLFFKQNESHEFILEELTRNGHEMTKEKLEEIIASLKK